MAYSKYRWAGETRPPSHRRAKEKTNLTKEAYSRAPARERPALGLARAARRRVAPRR